MKLKTLFILLLAMVAFSATYAQKFSLRNEKRITLSVNWSEATIVGYTDQEIINYEPDWEKDQPALLRHLWEKYNKKMGMQLPGALNVTSNYTLELRPLTVNKNGDMLCYAVILDHEGTVVAQLPKFQAEGGHVGTFLNLVGDGMKSAGTQLGKRIKKYTK